MSHPANHLSSRPEPRWITLPDIMLMVLGLAVILAFMIR